MINKGLFTSATDEWSTPQAFFDSLNSKIKFDLDVCASDSNHKCDKYFTKEDDGLQQPWEGNVWCNPPYGRSIARWVMRASEYRGGLVVMLLPARTDTKWFQTYIYKNPNAQVIFLNGRLKFGDAKTSAPFPSMIVIFNLISVP